MQLPEKKWVGYVVLVAGLVLAAHARRVLSNYPDWGMPDRVASELSIACLLIALGIIAIFAKTLARFVRNCAAGERLHVTDGFDHESTEQKRKERLPLREKRSAMADFGLLGSLTVIAIIFPVYLMYMASWHPYRSKGIFVKLPAARESQPSPATRQTPIVVSVVRGKETAHYLLNGKGVGADQLQTEIRTLLAKRGEWTVFVEGDSNMPFSDIVFVCDTVNTLGGHPVFLTPKMRQEAANKAK